MKKRLLIFLILYLLSSHFSIAFAENYVPEITKEQEELSLLADSAILMDAKTGQVLYDKNMHKKQYPASITKLMTVLLALEYDNPQEIITFSKEAVFGIERNSSHIAIDVGEQITIEQGLYAIMLASANEAALGVAEQIGQSIEGFSSMMNQRAKELGCTNTHFVNPNGLHDEEHYTTAYDMALITREVLKFDHFREIAATTYYVIPPTNKQPESRYLYAQHKMLKKNSSFYYEPCEGGKTGFTNQALNTLVSFAKQGDTELIAVVLHDAGTGIYTDTTALFDYGFEKYETKTIFSAEEFTKSYPVQQNYKKKLLDVGNTTLTAKENIYATLPKSSSIDDISQKIICDDILSAPVEEGSQQGILEIYYQGKKMGSTALIAQSSVLGFTKEELKEMDKAAFFDTIKTIALGGFLALVVLFLLYCVAFRIYNHRLLKKRKRRFRQKYRSRQ